MSYISEMRKHIGWYTAGIKGAARLRVSVNKAESAEQIRELIRNI